MINLGLTSDPTSETILPAIAILALVAFFADLCFQLTTINGSWQELSRSYGLRKKFAWKKWPDQTIYIVPKEGPFRTLRTAILRRIGTVAVSEMASDSSYDLAFEESPQLAGEELQSGVKRRKRQGGPSILRREKR